MLGYGQDDSVCAYTSLVAQLAVAGEELDRAAVCVLVDKEEIGSVGATGMASQFFENTIAEIMELAGEGGMLPLRRALAASAMLSSDVSAGSDPAYANVFEAKNSAYLGHGLVIQQVHGGARQVGQQRCPRRVHGAHPQDHGRRRRAVPNLRAGQGRRRRRRDHRVHPRQVRHGRIDSGVAVLSMHSPWEATSKADIYEAERGYEAFLRA